MEGETDSRVNGFEKAWKWQLFLRLKHFRGNAIIRYKLEGASGGENEKNVCEPKLGFAHCPWIIESYPGAKRINPAYIETRFKKSHIRNEASLFILSHFHRITITSDCREK